MHDKGLQSHQEKDDTNFLIAPSLSAPPFPGEPLLYQSRRELRLVMAPNLRRHIVLDVEAPHHSPGAATTGVLHQIFLLDLSKR